MPSAMITNKYRTGKTILKVPDSEPPTTDDYYYQSSGYGTRVTSKAGSTNRSSIRDNYREITTLVESIDSTVSNYMKHIQRKRSAQEKLKPTRVLFHAKSKSPMSSLYEDGTVTQTTGEDTKMFVTTQPDTNAMLLMKISMLTDKNNDLMDQIDGYADIISLKDQNIAKKGEIIENLEQLTMKFETMLVENSEKKARTTKEYEELKQKHNALKDELTAHNADIAEENAEIAKCKSAMDDLFEWKKVTLKAIEELRAEMEKNEQIAENWKRKSQIQEEHEKGMEKELRQSQVTIDNLTSQLHDLKEIEKEQIVYQKNTEAQQEKIHSLKEKVKRLSNGIMHRRSDEVDEYEKRISVLESKLNQKRKTIEKLAKQRSSRSSGKAKSVSHDLLQDLKRKSKESEQKRRETEVELYEANDENQRLMETVRDQDEVIRAMNANQVSMVKQENMRWNEVLAAKENEIKRWQVQIIDKNIDLERYEDENARLSLKIEHQNEKMQVKDEKLNDVKQALDEMLNERDRLIAETKEIKQRMSEFAIVSVTNKG